MHRIDGCFIKRRRRLQDTVPFVCSCQPLRIWPKRYRWSSKGAVCTAFVYCLHRAALVSEMNWAVLRQKHRERPERERRKKRRDKKKGRQGGKGRGETDRKCEFLVLKKQAHCNCVTDGARGVDKMFTNRSFKNSLARKLFRYFGKNTGMILAWVIVYV